MRRKGAVARAVDIIRELTKAVIIEASGGEGEEELDPVAVLAKASAYLRRHGGIRLEEGEVMQEINWNWRVQNYHEASGFPQSLFIAGDGRVVGTWIMGNDYRVKSGYHGGYPATYLKRVKALFPDKRRVLHLFAGKVDTTIFPGRTLDRNPLLDPDYLADAETMCLIKRSKRHGDLIGKPVPIELFDLVLADPPYAAEDAEVYGTPMVNRSKVLEALKRLRPGAHVAWLDQVLPMYSKQDWKVEAVIGIVRSTNHRFRVLTVFRRQGAEIRLEEPRERF